jgi:hypothetical protein
MAFENNTSKNIVQLRPSLNTTVLQAEPKPNISALARQYGVSRATIRNRLAKGWQPPPAIDGEIIPPHQGVATPATPHGNPVQSYWRAVGRSGVGLAIIATGAWIAVTSMAANGWFGASISPDPVAGRIYANLSVAAEVMACLIPTGIRFYCNGGERWTASRGWALMAICLAVVFLASGGFAISNLNAGIEARAERETSTVRDLRTQIAGLDRSIASECTKRGDRCRDLERQRAEANAKLGIERASLKADADPQAAALGISSTRLHLVQAGAMVALCLFSGLFISFGAGLIWPR